MLRFVYVLFPQSGIFQIVEGRLLAARAFLLLFHPNDSVFHANNKGKQ
tara:strand:+ start:728 stop:871 length:144 start_codon:yes stop_codon:yes gene_type:complete